MDNDCDYTTTASIYAEDKFEAGISSALTAQYDAERGAAEAYKKWLLTPTKTEIPTSRWVGMVKATDYQKLASENLKLATEILNLMAKLESANMWLDYGNAAVKSLKDMVNVQIQPGNFDSDSYMRGLANGLILAFNLFVPEDEQLELKPFVDKALKKRRFG